MKFLGALLIALCFCGSVAFRRVIPQPFENKHGLWTGPIVLGSPSQWNQLHLDTTSGDFFFVDSNCKNGCTANRNGFNSTKSSTFMDFFFRIPYSTTYMGSTQKGRYAMDALTGLGLSIAPRLIIPLVDQTSGKYTQGYGDGVMGLGFKTSKSLFPCTLFELVVNLALEDASYSFHVDKFSHTQANGFEDSGYGIYGGIDTDACDASTVVYHPISKSKQWSLKVEKFVAGTLTLNGGHALVKPGPFQILGPKSEIDKIFNTLKVQKDSRGDATINCNIINQLPAFELIIEGQSHKIEAKDYTIQSDNNSCYLLFKELNPSESHGADWVLGDALFRDRCVVFSYAKNALGFTARK